MFSRCSCGSRLSCPSGVPFVRIVSAVAFAGRGPSHTLGSRTPRSRGHRKPLPSISQRPFGVGVNIGHASVDLISVIVTLVFVSIWCIVCTPVNLFACNLSLPRLRQYCDGQHVKGHRALSFNPIPFAHTFRDDDITLPDVQDGQLRHFRPRTQTSSSVVHL